MTSISIKASKSPLFFQITMGLQGIDEKKEKNNTLPNHHYFVQCLNRIHNTIHELRVTAVVVDRISALEILDRFRCPHCNSTSPPRRLGLGLGSCCWDDLKRNLLGTPSTDELVVGVVNDPPLNPLPAIEVVVMVVSSFDALQGEGLKYGFLPPFVRGRQSGLTL